MIRLILAKEDDFEFFYEIKVDADNMFWTGYSSAPIRDSLYKFFIEQISKQNLSINRKIFIITEIKETGIVSPMGYLYLDPIDIDTAAVSVAVLMKYSGRGIGRVSLEESCEAARNSGYRYLTAYVREDNIRSEKMFKAVGFQRTEEYKLLMIENLGKEIKMLRYSKEL